MLTSKARQTRNEERAEALRHIARRYQENGNAQAASRLTDEADALEAVPAPRVYVVPVDPADATICEACE